MNENENDIEELVDMLTGKSLPEGVFISNSLNLSRKQASSVVWFLQEHMKILPSNFEFCNICESIFDTHCDGYIVDGTDIPDEFQVGLGVTQEMLSKHDGTMFCSIECEAKHWQLAIINNRRKVRNEKNI